jgi:hypothetical protein
VGDNMGIENVVDDCNKILSTKKNSISTLLNCFGKFVSNIDYDPIKDSIDTYVKESQFAIVFKYISDEKKSDWLTFKNDSNVNAKATDFVNGLDKYLRNICQSLVNAINKEDGKNDVYATKLRNELRMIRGMSGHSLAQSLSTKLNRYDDSKALITAVYDALQRGVNISKLGEIFAQSYVSQTGSSKVYGGVIPRYKEYMDRQKAINNTK